MLKSFILWTLQRAGIALVDSGLFTILFLPVIRLRDSHALVCVIARSYIVVLLSWPRNVHDDGTALLLCVLG